MIVLLRRKKILQITLCGVLALALHFLGVYLASDELDQADLTKLAGHTVIIDPGHGGIDSGASGNGIVEKEINLILAQEMAQVLANYGAVVTLTRAEDVDYYTKGRGGKRHDLKVRMNMMDQSGAELFISIHLNATPFKEAEGAQVFYGGTLPESKELAENLQKALKIFPPGNRRESKQDLDILVLNGTHIPGVLIECGYVTNQAEAHKLKMQEYQQKLVWQIAKGLAYHFTRKEAR
ncbi:MAG: N-acetylmuramoyl-L-alanine amidase [Sporomusaceae bacterium]|nr:N-acetylmuramoyl-L-alanine amidase [Sporomusaceae bacterium]